MFSPNSSQAHSVNNLLLLTTAIGAVILLIVSAVVFYSAFRYRSDLRPGEPRQIFGNRNLELLWTGIPVILLIVLFGFTINTMVRIDPAPSPQQQPDVIITGYQWWWHVEYPQAGVVTANEIHIPVGRQVLFELRGGDVIHSFWVPQLGPKRDTIPGRVNHLWLEANTPDVYLGACAEYCGTQHAWMRIRIIAQPQAEYEQWLQQQRAAAAAPTGGEIARGAQIFQQQTCVNCHAIQGTGANGQAGPNLTHLGSRQTIGAGVVENTPANLASWIKDPRQIKPGVNMPGYQLSDADLQALVAYLESLK